MVSIWCMLIGFGCYMVVVQGAAEGMVVGCDCLGVVRCGGGRVSDNSLGCRSRWSRWPRWPRSRWSRLVARAEDGGVREKGEEFGVEDVLLFVFFYLVLDV